MSCVHCGNCAYGIPSSNSSGAVLSPNIQVRITILPCLHLGPANYWPCKRGQVTSLCLNFHICRMGFGHLFPALLS